MPADVWEIRMLCHPDQAPLVTTIQLYSGWSESAAGPCVVANAFNSLSPPEPQSAIVWKSYPEDCVAVPEDQHAGVGLGVGLVLLAVLARARR